VTSTSNRGSGSIVPFIILFTVPLTLSKTKISFVSKKAILVIPLIVPLKTTSVVNLSSLMIGPVWEKE
jgi:hypothetical protein